MSTCFNVVLYLMCLQRNSSILQRTCLLLRWRGGGGTKIQSNLCSCNHSQKSKPRTQKLQLLCQRSADWRERQSLCEICWEQQGWDDVTCPLHLKHDCPSYRGQWEGVCAEEVMTYCWRLELKLASQWLLWPKVNEIIPLDFRLLQKIRSFRLSP